MKLLFTSILNLLLFSCSSAANENDSVDARVEGKFEYKEMVQNSTVDTISKMEKDNVISQEDIVSVDVEDKKIIVTITNYFPEEIYYDAKFFFERFNKGKWQKIPYVRNYGIPSIEYILKPGETRTHLILFTSFAIPFTNGKYRVIKSYNLNDNIKREVIKEFNID